MDVENIPKKLVCRYVGNRFHVLFHLSAVFHAYSSHLFTTYLKKFCNNTAGLRTSLLADIQNKTIQIQLKAMGLFGKLLTGPWMVIFYKNEEKSSNVSMQPFIMKKAIAWLEEKVETPQGLLTTADAFGRQITGDHIRETLCGPVQAEQDDCFSDVVRKLSGAFLTVLQRQLKRYLEGDLSQLPQDVIDKTASAPSHNMYAEGVLCMTDAQKRRSPNASDGFIDAKVKFQKKNTMKWLNDKTVEEVNKIVHSTRARQIRAILVERRKKVEARIWQRQQAHAQQRDKTARNQTEKKVKQVILAESSLAELFQVTERLDAVVKDPGIVVGMTLQHIWHEEGNDVIYNGKVLAVKEQTRWQTEKKGKILEISSWKDDEGEPAAEDYHIPLLHFLTDAVIGDLILME